MLKELGEVKIITSLDFLFDGFNKKEIEPLDKAVEKSKTLNRNKNNESNKKNS